MTSRISKTPPAVVALRRAGVPEDVARAARLPAMRQGVPLARMIAIAEAESGFRNIWGHDAGKWREDGPLTKASVARYFAQPSSRRPNGAGVWQLTYDPFQRQAEAAGGLHLLTPQARIATAVVKGLPHSGATAAGLSRYNGTGPAAELYGERVHAREAHWQAILDRR